MHELSIARALIAQATSAARSHGGGRIRHIRLAIGPLSGVEPALLARAFLQARTATPAATADLHIETPPVRVSCPACGTESAAALNRLVCATCGSNRVTLASGDELLLLGLDLDPAKEATHV